MRIPLPRRPLLILVACLLNWMPARAQREYFNWYFGNSAGTTFTTSPAQGLADGKRSFPYGAACISDSAGRFVLASDGFTIWNRQWQVVAQPFGTQALASFVSRQVVMVRQPGPGRRYLVLRSSAYEHTLLGPHAGIYTILPYAIVDLNANGGLGGVVQRDSLALPATSTAQFPYQYLYSNWVPIRHANGRDLWLVGLDIDGHYVSSLLSAGGLAPPVLSQPLPLRLLYLGDGLMRASPDGRTLASVAYTFTAPRSALATLEISHFNAATGEVTGTYNLPQPFRGRVYSPSNNNYQLFFTHVGGLALSPDGSRLYADTVGASGIFQYNLLAGTPAAIAASRATVLPEGAASTTLVGDLQLGPDGNVYIMQSAGQLLGRIEQANAPAPFCRLANGPRLPVGSVSVGAFVGSSTFPSTLPDLGLPPVQITSSGTIQGPTACAGDAVPFSSSLSPFLPAAIFAWDFGDPASGALNLSSGQAPTHRYTQPGTYVVTLQVSAAGSSFATQLRVVVRPLPTLSPSAGTEICAGGVLVLSPGPQPAGTTYRWQDGSTAPTFTASQPGPYAVTVTGPNGCPARATWQLTTTECNFQLPNVITPNGDQANDTFVLPGLDLNAWTLTIYNRWGREVYRREGYDNSWAAEYQPAGTYYYLLLNQQTGQRLRGWVEVVK